MWTAIKGFFTTTLYQPIYNGLIFLIDIIPGGEVGLAVIALTLLVKLALLPLSVKSVRTQRAVKEIQPKIDEIKEKYEDDREKQAQKMMEAYSEHNVNPFSGFALLLIQFPIIIALYYVFLRGGLPEIDPTLVYSFIPTPEDINMIFLGTNLGERSLLLALIAGGSQFLQSWLGSGFGSGGGDSPSGSTSGTPSFMDEFKENIGSQLKYIFPGIVFAISYSLPAVVATYWATSNLFHVLQEVYVKKTVGEENPAKDSSESNNPAGSEDNKQD